MAKTVDLILATLFLVSLIVPSLGDKVITYPVIGKGGDPGKQPKTPENPYNRSCETPEKCRSPPAPAVGKLSTDPN